MLGGYKILTITHRNANLQKIGDFVVQNTDADTAQTKLQALKAAFGIEELLYLSTCNRVMYFFYTKAVVDEAFISNFFYFINPNLKNSDTNDSIAKLITLHEDDLAIRHLYEVAASIDSLVIGEREILRQLREAFEQSKAWGLTGDNIRLAMRTTVEIAKEVYAQTRIGEKPISIVSLSIKKLLATNLSKDARILMIGAGQTNLLVAKFLKKHGYTNVFVFNRTLKRAQNIANLLGGKAFLLEDLENYTEGFDGMIVCTGSTSAIITQKLYKKLLGTDTRQKVVVDLSVPYNVASDVVRDFDIEYIEIEGLRQLANKNMAFREREVTKVIEILNVRLEEFRSLYQQRIIERAMKQLPIEIKAIKQKAIDEIFKKELDTVDDDAKALILKMLTYMEKRCISIPMLAAKNAVAN